MGDISVVRGSVTGVPRAQKYLAGGAIEEGDLFTITAGEAIKVADNGAAVAGVAMETVADEAYLTGYRLYPGTVLEGADLSTTDIVVGDLVGIDVAGATGAITFDVGATNKTFKCVKVVEAGVTVQCEVLDSVIG